MAGLPDNACPPSRVKPSAALAALELGLGVELARRGGAVLRLLRRRGGAGSERGEKGGGEKAAGDLGHGKLLIRAAQLKAGQRTRTGFASTSNAAKR